MTPENRPDYRTTLRFPTEEEWTVHTDFTKFVKSQGLDICRVINSLERAFLTSRGNKEVSFESDKAVYKISMQNNFLYAVQEPRRVPFGLQSVKSQFRRTFSSLVIDAYIRDKARTLGREFSFRDFLELEYSSFRRSVRRQKRKGLIMANPQRTTPRFFFLPEKLPDYK
jgi:hypothetical protein